MPSDLATSTSVETGATDNRTTPGQQSTHSEGTAPDRHS
jgi:hypothetical protein